MINQSQLQKIADLLLHHHLLIATAESCTGGYIAHMLTNISGSSEYFVEGVISYSNQSKIQRLSVPEEIIDTHGAVSLQTATAMAQGIRKLAQTDIGLATTGIAGPTGGTPEKPVGLVYTSISTNQQTTTNKHLFSGTRLENKINTSTALLHDLLLLLQNW